MYNCTGQRWLESTYSATGEEKVYSTIAKPGMFELGIAQKENIFAYSKCIRDQRR